MGIKELYIHNYKSFYDTTIKLGKTNIAVGENNSGKSNLIDFLEFLDIAIAKDLERAIEDKGGFDAIRNYKYDDKRIIGRIGFDLKEGSAFILLGGLGYSALLFASGDYTYSFLFTKDYYIISIKVNIISIAAKDENLIEKFLETHTFDTTNLKPQKVEFTLSNKIYFDKSKQIKKKLFIKKGTNREFVNEHIYGIMYKIGAYIDEEYRILKFKDTNLLSSYYIDAKVIKEQSHKEVLGKLKKDGSNLGAYLYHNLTPQERETVSNSLIGVVNEINGIEVANFKNNYIITFKERSKEVNIEQVSDGTVNLLATIAALCNSYNKSKLLVFEEPERHLHLKAIGFMLEMFRENKRQILVTSHSSEILKYANLDEIIFMYRDSDGDTQAVRAADIDGLEDKLKNLAYERELTVDELIADGIIGDFE